LFVSFKINFSVVLLIFNIFLANTAHAIEARIAKEAAVLLLSIIGIVGTVGPIFFYLEFTFSFLKILVE